METEDKLKKMIIARYGSILQFSKQSGIPNTTLISVFERGLLRTNISTVIRLCEELNLSVDEIAKGNIVPASVRSAEMTLDGIIQSAIVNLQAFEVTIDGTKLTDAEKHEIVTVLEIIIEYFRRRK